MQRVSIFVDGANMYYAQKKLGWYIDFRKVLYFFGKEAGNTISEAYYYTGADSQSKNRDVAFHEYLMYSGYTVRTKAIKQMVDDTTGEIVEKANLDIELVIDMFNTVTLYETCILMSGDGDFERALELVRSKGKRIAVVAHPDMTARELRNVAGRNYFDLRDLERFIARTDRLPETNSLPGAFQDHQMVEGLPVGAEESSGSQVAVWRTGIIPAQAARQERY
ncbi:MAG TPA: NYN domain-containing protein [Chthonomonadaceae bacterium]|nr:NYN domain-containing protein [Chthonomonadaceae bacterium]